MCLVLILWLHFLSYAVEFFIVLLAIPFFLLFLVHVNHLAISMDDTDKIILYLSLFGEQICFYKSFLKLFVKKHISPSFLTFLLILFRMSYIVQISEAHILPVKVKPNTEKMIKPLQRFNKNQRERGK